MYLCSGFFGGIYIVNRENEFIYIDNMYNIRKFLMDMENFIIFIEIIDFLWRLWCVYWLLLSGDLLVVIYKIGIMIGKVKWYN